MIQRTRLPWTRRGYPHAQVHFPQLTPQEALLAANLFDRVRNAIWRAHGDAMADLLGCCDPDDALPKEFGEPAVLDPEPSDPSDDDIF